MGSRSKEMDQSRTVSVVYRRTVVESRVVCFFLIFYYWFTCLTWLVFHVDVFCCKISNNGVRAWVRRT